MNHVRSASLVVDNRVPLCRRIIWIVTYELLVDYTLMIRTRFGRCPEYNSVLYTVYCAFVHQLFKRKSTFYTRDKNTYLNRSV